MEKQKQSNLNLKEVSHKIEEKIDLKLLLFKIFDDPRPEYVAKVTITDKIIKKTLLWAFPEWVRPNYVTVFRFVSIPFIIWMFLKGQYLYSTILFVVSAFSDAIDGAIARTRNKITDWGIVFDPVTDKLLIGIVGGVLISKFISIRLAIIIVSIEILLMTSAYYRFKGEIVPAKMVGKIKMILQCIGVGLIFLFLILGNSAILGLATYIFYLAIAFALLSLLVYRSI